LIAELAELSGVPVRTLRYYVEQRLIEPSEFRGTATRYQRRELLRLFATLRLRAETRLKLSEIRKRIDVLGERELESWLREQPLPPTLARALAVSSTGAAPSTSPVPTPPAQLPPLQTAAGAVGELAAPLLESWQRIRLGSSLELLVRSDASPEVRGAALRICADYLGKIP